MNFLDLVSSRRSVRTYRDQPIQNDELMYIMECVRLAPSAVNFQPWLFIVVKSKEQQENLHKCYPREWFIKAPLYIIACADNSQSWKRKDGKGHGDIDVSIAIEHLCLAATEKGIGTCWVCNFDESLCKELFDFPQHITPVAIIPLGYPDTEIEKVTKRKEMEDIVKYV